MADLTSNGLPPRVKDITGKKFGRLTAIEFSGWYRHRTGKCPIWKFQCECGVVCEKRYPDVQCGRIRSCGCLRWENIRRMIVLRTKHGDDRKGKTHPVYKAWTEMHQRCDNTNSSNYPKWGGRGIKVLWQSYEEFKRDMFSTWERGLTIERKDNNGHYCKENCIWATQKVQARNRRSNVLIAYDGQTMPMAAWAEKVGISNGLLWARLNKLGWSVDEALTTPVRTRNRQ